MRRSGKETSKVQEPLHFGWTDSQLEQFSKKLSTGRTVFQTTITGFQHTYTVMELERVERVNKLIGQFGLPAVGFEGSFSVAPEKGRDIGWLYLSARDRAGIGWIPIVEFGIWLPSDTHEFEVQRLLQTAIGTTGRAFLNLIVETAETPDDICQDLRSKGWSRNIKIEKIHFITEVGSQQFA